MQDNIYILPSRGPAEPEQAFKSNLPAQLTSFIGREQEVAQACALLRRRDVRLLTFTGPGGVGKTRLALQVATDLLDDFADGVYFVSLAPISDPDFVLPAIAQTLGLKEAGNQPLSDLLKEYVRNLHILLFLDNFEQVEAAAPLVADLLVSCPELKILVTSRAVLRIQGEHEFPVPPLALPDLKQLPDSASLTDYVAVALFLQRAQAIKPDFQIKPSNAQAIAEICTRLDGLPLAIELAAARIKLLSPQALLSRLGQRLTVLTDGTRDAPARQQTLRNTIKWSYDLLDAQEQKLFRCLCVFAGGCTLETIEEVCHSVGDEMIEVLDTVSSLIDKSLVQQTEQETGEPRLIMLETVREYGRECVRGSAEAELIQRAHALYYLALAEEAEPHLKGARQIEWLRQLELEHENLRAALEWLIEYQETELALRISGALRRFWYMRGYWSEGRQWLHAVLEMPQASGRTVARAKVLRGVGVLLSYENDVAARLQLEESVTICRKLGSNWVLSRALIVLGSLASFQGNQTQAATLLQESLTIAREQDNKSLLPFILYNLGYISRLQDNVEQVAAWHNEGLSIAQEIGYKWGIGLHLIGLARAASDDGQPERVARLFGAAENWIDPNVEMDSFERADYEHSVAAVRSQLGEKAFAAAWAEVKSMTLEQVLAVQKSTTIPEQAPEGPRSSTSRKLSLTYPSGLTEREVEVLRLVAQGLTDAQVAEQLVISRRTVNWYLTTIYSKIGVSSRSAATRYAMEQKLV